MSIPIVGDIISAVINKGSDLIAEIVTDKDEAARLDHAFRSQISAQSADIKKIEMESETRMFESEQVTHQAALNQADLYTKRTRPKIARQSWYLTISYAVFSTIVAPILGYFTAKHGPDGEFVAGVFSGVAFQWEVFIAVASPALAYMGVRGFEKWKNGMLK